VLGTVFHYSVSAPEDDHGRCVAHRDRIIAMHEGMGYRPGGAYNGHFCHHGESWISYLGPNQASGHTWANLNLHAWCYLATVDTPVTSEAAQAAYELTLVEPSGRDQMYPHSAFFPTSCCGDPLRDWIAAGALPPSAARPEQEDPMSECLVKNADNGQWFYFPPFCAPPRAVDPGFVLARASFTAHGESNGPSIVAMAEERAVLRRAFASEIAGLVPVLPVAPVPGPGGAGGVAEWVISGRAVPAP